MGLLIGVAMIAFLGGVVAGLLIAVFAGEEQRRQRHRMRDGAP